MKSHEDDNSNIFSFLPGLDKLIHVVADMVENEKEEVNIGGNFKPEDKRKLVGKYAFHIKMDPGKADIGKLKFQDLSGSEDKQPKTIVPVSDVFEEEDRVTIVVELPGIDNDEIELIQDKNTLTIKAAKEGICYIKKIELDFMPVREQIQESFHHSIYSVMITRKQ